MWWSPTLLMPLLYKRYDCHSHEPDCQSTVPTYGWIHRFLPLYRPWRNQPVAAITEFILNIQSGLLMPYVVWDAIPPTFLDCNLSIEDGVGRT